MKSIVDITFHINLHPHQTHDLSFKLERGKEQYYVNISEISLFPSAKYCKEKIVQAARS